MRTFRWLRLSCSPQRRVRRPNAQGRRYGFRTFGDYFAPRQLVAMTTFSDLVQEALELAKRDALGIGIPDDGKALSAAGAGPIAYSQAISVYLACALSRLASYNNTICHWNMRGGSVGGIFSRQAIAMSWDYIEVNPLEKMSGNWAGGIEWICDVLNEFVLAKTTGSAEQADASRQEVSTGKIISTDLPTTITSATLICRTSSTSGYAVHCVTSSLTCLLLLPHPRPRSWSPHRTDMALEKRPKRSFSPE
jgi:putative DNA methylase